ncbi:hypothetical protein TCAL_16166 [Tigriopus californicus]|uniref:Mitochondrial inner membrane protein Mpv17 n=1 Tax=Tigriopus californicus TaxID=6832 RepID=A0A553P1R0_TIGCA|nr:protein Mpv17-like [Tigriopus californicus]TRY71627.1 hypothetical protein TCAL_16166 [Tigriopus californicus]
MTGMPFRKFWDLYLHTLNKNPLTTQIVQTGALMGAGDVIAQKVLEKKSKFDTARCLRFVALGSFMVAPTIRVWYLSMERLVGPSVPKIRAALSKVALDQGCFAPTFNAVFLSVIGVCQGKNWEQVKEKLSREYRDVMLTNYTIWPPVQMINFFFVPFLLRPLVVSIIALVWNTYLSFKSN